VNITRRSILATIVALLLIPATALFGAESKKDQLKKRLRERAAQIEKLKADGVIGETDEGLVDFVKEKDAKSTDVVDAVCDESSAGGRSSTAMSTLTFPTRKLMSSTVVVPTATVTDVLL